MSTLIIKERSMSFKNVYYMKNEHEYCCQVFVLLCSAPLFFGVE